MTYEGESYVLRCTACESKTRLGGKVIIPSGEGDIEATKIKCTEQLCKTEWAVYTVTLPNGQKKDIQKRLTTPWSI